jgi:hypothetical protein
MKTLDDRDEVLYVDLKGRDPDEGMTQVAYVKGMLFLRALEEAFGRERFDTFLRNYFNNFAFRSITTADFLEYLQQNLLKSDPAAAKRVDVDAWLSKPGLPASAPMPKSEAFDAVSRISSDWMAGTLATESLPVKKWSTHETLHFLRGLEKIDSKRMADLDRAFQFTGSGNSEILFEWLVLTIRHSYQAAYPRLEQFLKEVGRRKYIRPLYQEMAKTPLGKERAKTIYRQARPGYHSIAAMSIAEVLK